MRRTLAILLALPLLAACGGELPSTPDAIATHVALEMAVAATLTAGAPTDIPADSQDLVATGVAVERAIALTLTAEAPTVTSTPVALPTAIPDMVATGVAVEKAVAATLTAAASTMPLAPATNTAAQTPEATQPPATDEPSPTAIPKQPAPTETPTPTEAPSPLACVSWRDANAYLGTHRCICGVVTGTYDDPSSSAFFINFDPDRTGYYAISFDHSFAGLEGRCVMVCGVVEDYRGRPQTVIYSVDQIQELATCP
jgi:hypothetical protein